jgi:hypothetical protein
MPIARALPALSLTIVQGRAPIPGRALSPMKNINKYQILTSMPPNGTFLDEAYPGQTMGRSNEADHGDHQAVQA